MSDAYRVFVVLDPEHGARLSEVAGKGPAWIVDTPANRAEAQKLWAAAADRERPHIFQLGAEFPHWNNCKLSYISDNLLTAYPDLYVNH